MRTIGIGLATLGAIGALVAFLFAFWAHEDIKQADRLGGALATKVERGDPTKVEIVEMVFDTEIDKLEKERLAWGLGGLGGAVIAVVGVALAALNPRLPGLKVPRAPRLGRSSGPARPNARAGPR